MQPLQKHETKRQYLARQRSRARAINGRLYATCDGRLLLVRGMPDAVHMFRYLAHLDIASPHIVKPTDLGFPRGMVEEFTPSMLAAASRALTKWSRTIDFRRKCRRTSDQDHADEREIERLQVRLEQLYEWKRLTVSTDLAEKSPWVLDEEQEAHLSSLLCCSYAQSELAQRFHWLARIVMWIGGKQAAERFCDAARLLTDEPPEAGARKLLRASMAKLNIWRKRSENELWGSIQQEMRQWICGLPTRVVARARLTAKLRGKSLPAKLVELQLSCTQSLRECNDGSTHRVAAAIATITAADNASAPIPPRLVRYWIEQVNDCPLQHSVLELIGEAKQPAYDCLLRALDELSIPLEDNARFIRQQLWLSQSIPDIEWAVEHDLQVYFEETTAPQISWIRRQFEQLHQAGIPLTSDQMHRVLRRLDSHESRSSLGRFIDWLVSLPRPCRTPKACQLLGATLLEVYLPAVGDLRCHELLRKWARMAKVPSGQECLSLEHWTQAIYQCQELLGVERRLPKTIRSILQVRQARHREYEYLLQLERRGVATDAQLARMRYLRDEAVFRGAENTAKLLRSVQDTFLHVAVDALQEIVRVGAERAMGDSLARKLCSASLRRILQFAGWVRETTAIERRLLEEVIEAHQTYGTGYKRVLTINNRWLKAALSRGMNIDAWLEGEITEFAVGDSRVRIDLAQDPIEVFLMGTYFDTCLSLGKENQLAVLANAADANKQVVYAMDEDGHVIARQLLAISSDFSLLGYFCYLHEDAANDVKREHLAAVMAAYCGNLARRCGLPLADEGEPASLGEHFWYDDEPVEWHQAARDELLQSGLETQTLLCMAECLA